MSRIRVLSPIGEVRREAFAAPTLPADLAGLTVGFIDNTKHNFDRLTDEIGALLSERHGVKAVVRRRKANAAVPARRRICGTKNCSLGTTCVATKLGRLLLICAAVPVEEADCKP